MIHSDNDSSRQILIPEMTAFSISDNDAQPASEVTPTNASSAPNPEPHDPFSSSRGPPISEESGEGTISSIQNNDNVDDSSTDSDWDAESDSFSRYDDDDDDDDEDNVPILKLRPARRDESWTQRYINEIKPLLEQFLNESLSDYFMVLCVVTCEGNDEEIPVIIIVHDEENEEELPRLAQFPAQIKYSDEFVLIVADGDTSMCAGDIDLPVNNAYYKHVISGISIEAKENGTVGLFVEDGENNFVGITCAHVAGTTEEKRHISQPTVEDLKAYILVLRDASTSLQTEISESKNDVLIFERTRALKFVENELKTLEPLLGITDDATRQNLRLGRVRTSENAVVDFRGRQCVADWSVFDIHRARSSRRRTYHAIQTKQRPVIKESMEEGGITWVD